MELKDEEKWEGARLSALNGIRLFRSAEAIAGIGQFGAASSLMVLSAEESAKALSLATSVLRDGPMGDVKKVFRNHTYKHNTAAFYLLLPSIADKIPIHLKAIEKDPEIPIENHPKELMKRTSRDIAKALDSGVNDLKAVIEWQKKANFYKKSGFYVDYQQGKWLTPEDISEEDFNSLKLRAIRLIQIMEVLVADNSIDRFKKTKGDLERLRKGQKNN